MVYLWFGQLELNCSFFLLLKYTSTDLDRKPAANAICNLHCGCSDFKCECMGWANHTSSAIMRYAQSTGGPNLSGESRPKHGVKKAGANDNLDRFLKSYLKAGGIGIKTSQHCNEYYCCLTIGRRCDSNYKPRRYTEHEIKGHLGS